MALIRQLKIKNFRGIKEFEHTFDDSNNFVCLIGRGDCGKTTILYAIYFALCPQWQLNLLDTDFYNCKVDNSIEIEVSISDFPESFLDEGKYGMFIRGYDRTTNTIHDELNEESEKVLTIKLTVTKDLEPEWCVINVRTKEVKKISHTSRKLLKVFLISDLVDNFFTWNKNSPLYSLLQSEDISSIETNFVLDSLRNFRDKINETDFERYTQNLEKIKDKFLNFGIDISTLNTTIDFRDIFIKGDKVSLHQNNIPLRLKGKGTKTLFSIAIQLAISDTKGIILIDEIETGLEPDRVQFLINALKRYPGQCIITTHSRDALVELKHNNFFLLRENAKKLFPLKDIMQGVVRSSPEAFFSKKIIVCEGPTEIGVCRAIDNYRLQKNKLNSSILGVRFVDGGGDSLIDRCKEFIKAKYEVLLFCDSDKIDDNTFSELESLGLKIVKWDNTHSLESSLIANLTINQIKKILNLHCEQLSNESNKEVVLVAKDVKENIRQYYTGNKEFKLEEYTDDIIKAIGTAMQKSKWFKRPDKSEELGDLLFKLFNEFDDDNIIKTNLNTINNWIDV